MKPRRRQKFLYQPESVAPKLPGGGVGPPPSGKRDARRFYIRPLAGANYAAGAWSQLRSILPGKAPVQTLSWKVI
jgi:hypothetical protein